MLAGGVVVVVAAAGRDASVARVARCDAAEDDDDPVLQPFRPQPDASCRTLAPPDGRRSTHNAAQVADVICEALTSIFRNSGAGAGQSNPMQYYYLIILNRTMNQRTEGTSGKSTAPQEWMGVPCCIDGLRAVR